MRNFTYHLLGMAIVLLGFCIGARLLVPLVQHPDFGRAAWHLPVLGAAFLASPLAGLLLFELASGRALGFGLSVIRRAESPRQYWIWITYHASLFLTILAATCAYFSKR